MKHKSETALASMGIFGSIPNSSSLQAERVIRYGHVDVPRSRVLGVITSKPIIDHYDKARATKIHLYIRSNENSNNKNSLTTFIDPNPNGADSYREW